MPRTGRECSTGPARRVRGGRDAGRAAGRHRGRGNDEARDASQGWPHQASADSGVDDDAEPRTRRARRPWSPGRHPRRPVRGPGPGLLHHVGLPDEGPVLIAPRPAPIVAPVDLARLFLVVGLVPLLLVLDGPPWSFTLTPGWSVQQLAFMAVAGVG